MKTIQWMAAVMAVTALFACKKEQDTTRPEILGLVVNGITASEYEVNAGQTISVRYTVSDNEALNQLKINVHAADDGHTHDGEGDGASSEEPNIGTWVYSQIINLSGTNKSDVLSLSIPDSIQGHWHIEANLIDASGNEAVEYVTVLHVINTNAPAFALNSIPAVSNGVISVASGSSTFNISGTVSDEQGVASVVYELENHTTGAMVSSGTMYTGSATVATIPDTAFGPLDVGTYHLIITARDVNGNGSVWFAEVEVP